MYMRTKIHEESLASRNCLLNPSDPREGIVVDLRQTNAQMPKATSLELMT